MILLFSVVDAVMPSNDRYCVLPQNVTVDTWLYDPYKTFRKVSVWLHCAQCFCFHCQCLLIKPKYRNKDPSTQVTPRNNPGNISCTISLCQNALSTTEITDAWSLLTFITVRSFLCLFLEMKMIFKCPCGYQFMVQLWNGQITVSGSKSISVSQQKCKVLTCQDAMSHTGDNINMGQASGINTVNSMFL